MMSYRTTTLRQLIDAVRQRGASTEAEIFADVLWRLGQDRSDVIDLEQTVDDFYGGYFSGGGGVERG